MVQLGDTVTQGEPLLAIDSSDADAALSTFLQAEASVTQAQATLRKAQADLTRLSDLFTHDAVAKREVLDAENAVTQARATVEQAQAARGQALRRLEILGLKPGDFKQQVIVRAPLAGKILEINVVPGEYRTDTTTSVMTVADLSTVWMSFDVPESAIRLIRAGEHVEISLVAYPGEMFAGRVRRMADTVDPQSRTVKVRRDRQRKAWRRYAKVWATKRAIGAGSEETYLLVLLAEACGRMGQTEEGLTVVTEALDLVDKSGLRVFEAELYRLKGELSLQSRQVKTSQGKSEVRSPESEAEECFWKAIEIARRQQAKSLELRAVMNLSRLWQQQGKKAEARQMLAEIYGWFTEGFDTADLKGAKALLEELSS